MSNIAILNEFFNRDLTERIRSNNPRDKLIIGCLVANRISYLPRRFKYILNRTKIPGEQYVRFEYLDGSHELVSVDHKLARAQIKHGALIINDLNIVLITDTFDNFKYNGNIFEYYSNILDQVDVRIDYLFDPVTDHI